MFVVQLRKPHGKYVNAAGSPNLNQALVWFRCYNTHSGHSKRLVNTDTGKIVLRVVS
jgi:hypothetical protein